MNVITQNPKTTAQVRHLFFLFKQLNIREENIGDLVWNMTNGRTDRVSELEFIEAQTMIRRLTEMSRGVHNNVREDTIDLDRKRKGCIKAIFRYLERKGQKPTMDYVKAIACRAAGCDFFNEISEAGLTRLYNEFCRKQQVINEINTINN